jgi:hypothetical protein
MQKHFLKVLSSVAQISESLLSVKVTSRRSNLVGGGGGGGGGGGEGGEGGGGEGGGGGGGDILPSRRLLQVAGLKVEVEVRAISVKQAKELVQLIESVIVTGVFAQASVLCYSLYYLLYYESVILTGVFAQASSLHCPNDDNCNNSSNKIMRIIGIVIGKVKVVITSIFIMVIIVIINITTLPNRSKVSSKVQT